MRAPGAKRQSIARLTRRATSRGTPWLLLCPSLALSPRTSRADPAAPADEAMAIFHEGVRLRTEEKFDEACVKFSQSLDKSRGSGPTAGMVLNVADCHEREGKVAKAWAEFLEASRLYKLRGDSEAIAECLRRASLLESRLSRLTIRVERPVAGLVVRRNGRVVEAAQLGVSSPVDAGEYVVTAEAPGHAPFSSTVLVNIQGAEVVATVPALSARLAPSAPVGGKPVAGYAVAGFGLAALSVGSTFGVMALASNAAAERACRSRDDCSSPAEARSARDRANIQAWAANVGVGVGLAGLVTGGYLLFLSSRGPKFDSGLAGRASVMVSPLPSGLRVDVQF